MGMDSAAEDSATLQLTKLLYWHLSLPLSKEGQEFAQLSKHRQGRALCNSNMNADVTETQVPCC